MACAGKHLIVEVWGCKGEFLDSPKKVEEMLKESVDVSGATLVDIKTHKFNPQGLSAVALLNESFMSIHSWPEIGYAAIDIYTSAPHVDLEKVIPVVKKYLKPKKIQVLNLRRGEITK
jgi:S-adenosylmethionine decarboxylase